VWDTVERLEIFNVAMEKFLIQNYTSSTDVQYNRYVPGCPDILLSLLGISHIHVYVLTCGEHMLSIGP
jgi:hypothetical protein